MPRLFGTDGIRGVANVDLKPSTAFALGRATAYRLVGEGGSIVVGARSDLEYALSTDRVLVTIGGSIAELDRLSGTNLVLTLDVGGLAPGTHDVTATANLTTGLTLISASPNPIQVTVSTPAPSPAPS